MWRIATREQWQSAARDRIERRQIDGEIPVPFRPADLREGFVGEYASAVHQDIETFESLPEAAEQRLNVIFVREVSRKCNGSREAPGGLAKGRAFSSGQSYNGSLSRARFRYRQPNPAAAAGYESVSSAQSAAQMTLGHKEMPVIPAGG